MKKGQKYNIKSGEIYNLYNIKMYNIYLLESVLKDMKDYCSV